VTDIIGAEPIEEGSLWLDNDPRTFEDHGNRYARIDAVGRWTVQCTTWYDQPDGTEKARRGVEMKISRFQPSSTGRWSRSGFRPAEVGPVYGRPA
jgi:hypothetical protein